MYISQYDARYSYALVYTQLFSNVATHMHWEGMIAIC